MIAIGIVLAAVSLLMVAGTLAFAVALGCARRVLFPRRQPEIEIIDTPSPGVIRLPLNKSTALEGQYGLLFNSERAHARIGTKLHTDHQSGFVDRVIETTTNGEPTAGMSARWTGDVFSGPEAVCPEYREVWIKVENGSAPAWLMHSNSHDKRTSWAIHIHGQLAGRETTLRSAQITYQMGFTTLIPSYRNDGDGPAANNGECLLGQTEWIDVEEAVRYAVDHGATDVLLFGGSMGASIALTLSERSGFRQLIRGLVLYSPVTSWESCIRLGVTSAGAPSWMASLTTVLLTNRLTSQLAGAAESLNLHDVNWCNTPDRLITPTLVVHSYADTTVSFMDTQRFAACNPDLVEIFDTPDAPHALEWNRASAEVDSAVVTWVEDHIGK